MTRPVLSKGADDRSAGGGKAVVSVRDRLLRCCGRAMGVVMVAASLVACNGHGPAGAGASPSMAEASPLTDDAVCGVISTQALEQELGLKVYRYSYSSGVNRRAGGGEPYGDMYSCDMSLDYDPYGLMEMSYSMAHVNGFGMESKNLSAGFEFDEVPVLFPESAVSVEYDGVEGEGWSWTYDVSAFLAWRYPDGHVLTTRLTSWTHGGPTGDQVKALQAVMEEVVPKVPEVAAAHVDRVKVPSPSPTP